MGQTDLAVRFLSERYLRELLPLLLRGHQVVVHEVMRTEVKLRLHRGAPEGREQAQFVERKNDEVVRADIDGVPTVLHVEFQSTHKGDLGLRLLAYHALLAGRYAPLPVRSLLVYLMHTPPSSGTAGFCDAQVRFECDVFRPWTSPIGLAEVVARPALAPIAALTPGIGPEGLGGLGGPRGLLCRKEDLHLSIGQQPTMLIRLPASETTRVRCFSAQGTLSRRSKSTSHPSASPARSR